MDLTQDQLKNSVSYPACDLDFTPLVLLSDVSDFFIYADWNFDCWSQSKEQYREKLTSKLNRPRELPSRQDVPIPQKPKKIAHIFQPQDVITRIETNLNVAEASDREDWGLRGSIIEKISTLNEQDGGDLEFVDDSCSVPLEAIGMDGNPQWPDKFQPQEGMLHHNKDQWAQQFTIQSGSKRLKMLCVCAEGLTAYTALFSSGKIAPKILVTVNAGCGYERLENAGGVAKEFLNCCDAEPLLWVRGGRGEIDPPAQGFYDEHVRKFENWYDYQVQAFCEKQHRTEAEQLFSEIP